MSLETALNVLQVLVLAPVWINLQELRTDIRDIQKRQFEMARGFKK